MNGSRASEDFAAPGRALWPIRHGFAWASVFIACVVLIGVIRYCPGYNVGRATLFEFWLGTFWADLSNQVTGLFTATPKETLSGEATASEWNYCMLVPPIAAWLVWRSWPQLRAAPVEGRPIGYAILAVGFFFYIAGFLMENSYIGIVALELIFAGLIVLFLGWPIMYLLARPWAFLLFMWPYNFMEDVALELRLVMSSFSHHVLQLMGVANLLQGTSIISEPGALRPFAIDIADPCSGIRSLFALIMIAAVYSFITFEKIWQQALMVALALPLVIFGNLVRIIILALATMYFGENFALGTNTSPSWFHEGAGYLVYLINFGGLIFAGSRLEWFLSRSKRNDHP